MVHLGSDRTRGEKAADRVASTVGSWRFIGIQSTILMLWMATNVFVAAHHFHFNAWDPYPFVFLNFCLSLQAAYTGPILQLSGNRRDAIESDRNRQMLEALLANMNATSEMVKAVKHNLEEQDVILDQIEVHFDDGHHEQA